MRPITKLVSILFCVGFVAAAVAENSDSVVAQLKRCATIDSRESRIECYESLGRQVLREEQTGETEISPDVSQASSPASKSRPASDQAATTSPIASTAAAAAGVEAKSTIDSDSLGGYQFETKSAAEKEAEQQMRTRVVLCQKDRDGVWYFKLENGQVWKQVDRQRLAFQGCDFGAIVTNDGIGYILRIDDRKGKIRIKRRK